MTAYRTWQIEIPDWQCIVYGCRERIVKHSAMYCHLHAAPNPRISTRRIRRALTESAGQYERRQNLAYTQAKYAR